MLISRKSLCREIENVLCQVWSLERTISEVLQ